MTTETYRVAASREKIAADLRDILSGEIVSTSCGNLRIEQRGCLGIYVSAGLLHRIAELLEETH